MCVVNGQTNTVLRCFAIVRALVVPQRNNELGRHIHSRIALDTRACSRCASGVARKKEKSIVQYLPGQ